MSGGLLVCPGTVCSAAAAALQQEATIHERKRISLVLRWSMNTRMVKGSEIMKGIH